MNPTDTEMIDWLERNQGNVIVSYDDATKLGTYLVCGRVTTAWQSGINLRDAVRKAMDQHKRETKAT
jgi:hypothetical protein